MQVVAAGESRHHEQSESALATGHRLERRRVVVGQRLVRRLDRARGHAESGVLDLQRGAVHSRAAADDDLGIRLGQSVVEESGHHLHHSGDVLGRHVDGVGDLVVHALGRPGLHGRVVDDVEQ